MVETNPRPLWSCHAGRAGLTNRLVAAGAVASRFVRHQRAEHDLQVICGRVGERGRVPGSASCWLGSDARCALDISHRVIAPTRSTVSQGLPKSVKAGKAFRQSVHLCSGEIKITAST